MNVNEYIGDEVMDDGFYIQMIKDLSRNDLAIQETEQQFDVLARQLELAITDRDAYELEIGELKYGIWENFR